MEQASFFDIDQLIKSKKEILGSGEDGVK